MAFTSAGSFGIGNTKTSGTNISLVTTRDIVANELLIIAVGADNPDTVAGSTDIFGASTGGGVTWNAATAWRKGGGGAANGADVGLLWGIAPAGGIASGTTITVVLSSAVSAKAATGWGWTYPSGQTIALANSQGADGMVSLSRTLDATKANLVVRATALEDNATTQLTPTSGFTVLDAAGTTGSGAASNMIVRGEWQASADNESGTYTSAPSGVSATDMASRIYLFTVTVPSGATTVTGSFTANAIIKKTLTASFSADAVVKKTLASSFTADASISILVSGSFTANAIIRSAIGGSFTANAIIRATIGQTFTADAVVRKNLSASFTADAQVSSGGGPSYSSVVTALSPVWWMPLSDASGVTAVATNGPNATYSNTPTLGVASLLLGSSDTAVTFDGAQSEYVQSNSNVNALGSAHALSVWISPTNNADTIFLSQASNSFLRRNADGSLSFRWLDAGSVQRTLITATGIANLGGPYFVVGTHDGTNTARIYLNGTEVAISTANTSLGVATAAWQIARHSTSGLYFTGTMDEVVLYGTGLTASDVTAIYNAGTSASSGGTVSQSFTANAIIRAAVAGFFTANAEISSSISTITDSFTANSIIKKTTVGSFTANAQISSGLPQPPTTSGEAMPVADLPGWTHVFSDDFDTTVALGSWPTSVSSKWQDYSGYHSFTGGYFAPTQVTTQHDSLLDMYLHEEAGTGRWLQSSPQPILDSSGTAAGKYQTYGRYAVRFYTETVDKFYLAWLTWPQSEVWPGDGEIDFPEGELDGNIGAYTHHQGATTGGDQDGFLSGVTTGGAWHTAVIEWAPNRVRYILDGTVIGTSINRLPNTPMRYAMMTTVSPAGFPVGGATARVWVDWVSVWSYNAATDNYASGTGYRDAVLALSPVGYWRFGEASGSGPTAASEIGPNATYSGSPTKGVAGLLTGDSNTAVAFSSATSQYAITGSLGVVGPSFSIAAWIKPTADADAIFIGQGSIAFLRRLADGSVVFRWTDSGGTQRNLTSAAGATVSGSTYFVVGTHDGTTARLYINGSEVTNTALYNSGTIAATGWYIGLHSTIAFKFTGTIDEPAVFNSLLSASDVADLYTAGTVGNRVTGSFTANAIIKQTISASFTANSIIKKTSSASITADSVIKKTVSASLTADALIKTIVSSSFTANAVIRNSIESSFTANAVVRNTLGASFTADAIIRRTESGSFTANAILRSTGSGTFIADAVIRNAVGASFTANAVIHNAIGSSFTANAVIQNVLASTFFADAMILRTEVATFTANSMVSTSTSASFIADAMISSGAILFLTADAVIKKTISASFTSNAVIKNTIAGALTTNAVIKVSLVGSFTANAIIRATVGNSFTTDAVIRNAVGGALTADAIMRTTPSVNFTANAIIRRTESNTLSADAVIRNTPTGAFTIDALIVVSGINFFTADAIIKGTSGQAFTADAMIKQIISGSFVADSVLRRTMAGTLSADAMISTLMTGSFTANATIAGITGGSFVANAVIKGTLASSFTANATVSRVMASTFTANAVVRNTLGGSFAANAMILRNTTSTFTADAMISRNTAGSFVADAMIERTITGSFTMDAIVRTTYNGSLNLESIIKRTQAAAFLADATISAPGTSWLTADAIIVAASGGAVTLNAIIQRTVNASFTASALIVVQSTSLGSLTMDADIGPYNPGYSGEAVRMDEHTESVVVIDHSGKFHVRRDNNKIEVK